MIQYRTEAPSTYYNIKDKIGSGGFGQVLKCQSKETGQVMAMKFVEIDTAKQKKYIGNEITLMRSLEHPNILKLSDAILFDSRMYMFMEYMDGGSLTPLVTSKKPFPEKAIAFILKKVAEGLNYLHINNIIHRDIKSDNILMKRVGSDLKICDFGYACQLTKEN